MSYAAALAGADFSVFPTSSRGISETARTLQGEFFDRFTRPELNAARQRLIATLSATRIAIPVSTFETALAFVSVLPPGSRQPEIVVEEHGDIAFDWQEASDLVLSVVVKSSRQLGYAALA